MARSMSDNVRDALGNAARGVKNAGSRTPSKSK